MLYRWQVKQQAEVPSFFPKLWTEKKKESPSENELLYTKLSLRSFNWGFFGGFGSFFFWVMLGTVAAVLRTFQSVQPVTSMLCGMMIGVVSSVVCLVIAYRASPERQKDQWHFEEYYTGLFELFTLFGITPNTEIGQLSKEEFAGMVASSLRMKMRKVDTLEGFARLADYNEFKRMHAAALEWGLCSPDYGKYDPKKA